MACYCYVFSGLYNCRVKEVLDNSIDAVECANLLRISKQEDDRSYTEIIKDIDKIFRTCDAFYLNKSKKV